MNQIENILLDDFILFLIIYIADNKLRHNTKNKTHPSAKLDKEMRMVPTLLKFRVTFSLSLKPIEVDFIMLTSTYKNETIKI